MPDLTGLLREMAGYDSLAPGARNKFKELLCQLNKNVPMPEAHYVLAI